MNALKRLGRFLWLLCGVLDWLIAIVIMSLFMWTLVSACDWVGGHRQVGLIAKSLVCGLAYAFAIALLAGLYLLAANTCRALSHIWHQSAHPL